MRMLLFIAGLALAGMYVYNNFLKPAPPPPPPPPPPAITTPPAPILAPEELRKIKEATRDSDANVRWEAAKFLSGLNHPDADPILFQMLAKDQEMQLRVNVCESLAKRKGPEVSRALVGALKDPEPLVRNAALMALAEVGDFSTVSFISDVLKDMDESVRLEAVKTLNILQEKKKEELRLEAERQEELRREAEEAAKAKQKKGFF